jgi:hypothetical protein
MEGMVENRYALRSKATDHQELTSLSGYKYLTELVGLETKYKLTEEEGQNLLRQLRHEEFKVSCFNENHDLIQAPNTNNTCIYTPVLISVFRSNPSINESRLRDFPQLGPSPWRRHRGCDP